MKYDPEKHHRRSIRLKGYDYSLEGAYYVTICTQERLCLFGNIVGDEMKLNDAGEMIETTLQDLTARFLNTEILDHVIMPNHVHMVMVINENDRRGESCIRPLLGLIEGDHKKGDHKDRPYHDIEIRFDECETNHTHPRGTEEGSLSRIIQAFKSITTVEYIQGVKQNGWEPFPGRLWQKNFFERIVRSESELNRIREYIKGNPQNWDSDEENPAN